MSMPSPTPRKSWLARNWIVVTVLLVVLLPILTCGGCIVGSGWLLYKAATENPAYVRSRQLVRADPRTQAVLGAGIEADMPTRFDVTTTNGVNTSDVSYGIDGTAGSGTVHAVGSGAGDDWTFTELTFTGGGQTIDLLADQAAAPDGSPPAGGPAPEDPDHAG